MATLGQWSLMELTGNSEFVLIGSTLYAVGNTTNAGEFAIYESQDYGITVSQVATYTFLAGSPPSPSPAAIAFDPAVCTDGVNLYIIGTRHNPPGPGSVPGSAGTTDIVWFKYTAGGSPPALIGPVTIVSGLLIGSDYDITELMAGGSPPVSVGETCAIICSFSKDGAWAEQVNSYHIDTNGVASAPVLITSSPNRTGSTFDSVSVGSPDGINLELYVTSHPKSINYADYTLALNVYTSPNAGSSWTPATSLLTLPVRHVSSDLTVITLNNTRWLSSTYYTQNRAGLSGNILLGYLADITQINVTPWSFKQFLGTPSASLVQPALNVFTDTSSALSYISRDLTRNPAVDGIISVNDLNPVAWQITPEPEFRNPNPFASWLRGTKSILPVVVDWDFIAESRVSPGTSIFYSGFPVPPIANIEPVAINPMIRNQKYTFDASLSFSPNFDQIEFLWSLVITSGSPPSVDPAWQPNHVFTKGTQIVDSNGNVQICTVTGLSAPVEPLAQWEPRTAYMLGQQIVDTNGNVQQVTQAGTSGTLTPAWNTFFNNTTGDGTVIWQNKGLAFTFWNTVINGLTVDNQITWATAITLVPALVPSTQYTTAVVEVGDVIGPLAETFYVQVAVIDLDTNNNPIHFPPVGNQIAQAQLVVPFIAPPVILWPGPIGSPVIDYSTNPVLNVARNSPLVLFPEIISGQVGLPLTYTWTQVAGTTVTTGATDGPTLLIFTNGVNINGETLTFQLVVNDDINPPVSSQVLVTVVPYVFHQVDSLTLVRSNFAGGLGFGFDFGVSFGFSQSDYAPIALRNNPLFWTPIAPSAIYTNDYEFKRNIDLQGESRFIVVSDASVLVYSDMEITNSSVLLRKLFIPDTDPGFIEDAVHTELDYTMVLTTSNNLYRYTTAILLNTDDPDAVLALSNYVTLIAPTYSSWQPSTAYVLGDEILDSNGNVQIVIEVGTSGLGPGFGFNFGVSLGFGAPTWNPVKFGSTNDGPNLVWQNLGPAVTFDSIFTTATFADVRVVALSGPKGVLLLQLNSQEFMVEGFFEISVESGLVYGADNVQWIREANVESLHSGQILLGTLDSMGNTFETLIDLVHRKVLGTWDASQLKNKYVTTGEILFEKESSYVGLAVPPVMGQPVLNADNSISLSWVEERPDLVSGYLIAISLDDGGFIPLTTIGSGVIQSYKTGVQLAGHTYAFQMQSVGPDGTSAVSNTVAIYVGIPAPPIMAQITQVGGVPGGPYSAVLNWTDTSPTPAAIQSYILQQSTQSLYPIEAHSVPAVGPFVVTVSNPPMGSNTFLNGGVVYVVTQVLLTQVASNPAVGQYSVSASGQYTFNAGDAGQALRITYAISTPFITIATPIGGTNQTFTVQNLVGGFVYNFRVAANFNQSQVTAFSGLSSIGLPLQVPPQLVPFADHDVAFSYQIQPGVLFYDMGGNQNFILYGVAPYTWNTTLVSGALPPGLQLDSNGVISGTPGNGFGLDFGADFGLTATDAGTYTIQVQVTDSAQPTNEVAVSGTLTIVVI
jgi:hypothetical protein